MGIINKRLQQLSRIWYNWQQYWGDSLYLHLEVFITESTNKDSRTANYNVIQLLLPRKTSLSEKNGTIII